MKKQSLILNFSFSAIFIIVFHTYAVSQTLADSIVLAQTHWETDTIDLGIIHKRALFSELFGEPQCVNYIEIDNKDYFLKAVVSDTLKFMNEISREKNAFVAINGTYYDVRTGITNCYYRKGTQILHITSDEELFRVTGAIVIKGRKIKLQPWNKVIENKYKKKNKVVMASGPLLVYKDKICRFDDKLNPNFYNVSHPRSAIGKTKDNRIILLTADGRHAGYAKGMTINQMAFLMKHIGCKDALNLDGGGSTTLWSCYAKDDGVLNCPSNNKKFDHHGERKNASVLIITK